ncbi:MAG: hypothetical protein OXC83_11785 [Chloroflexi bacterium]|nr:hypothetical protein [Chloroflexota bacterium]
MTRYKALISIMVIAVVAVATITWSPIVADARWAMQEGDSATLPATTPAAYVDVSGADECVAVPATLSISVGSLGGDSNTVVGKVDVQDVDDAETLEFHDVWVWCWTTVCKWIYTPDDGWQKVCYDKKIKCYMHHDH